MRYPSEEQMDAWLDEAEAESGITASKAPYMVTQAVARKACDWQREQDALICEGKAADEKWPASGAVRNCASAIRSGDSHDRA